MEDLILEGTYCLYVTQVSYDYKKRRISQATFSK